MIPIPVLGKRWRVSDLFKRRQGAWLEPRLGGMWQQSTWVNATTTGGQTVGALVSLVSAPINSFLAADTTSRIYRGMTAIGDTVYAATYNGDIYKKPAGSTTFSSLGQTSRPYQQMANNGLDVYVCTYGGDVYKQTAGTGDFIGLGLTSRTYTGVATIGADIYLCVYGGKIYKQTGGAGEFVDLGQATRNWTAITAVGNDVYAAVDAGDIYKQTNATGNFIALGLTSRGWSSLTNVGGTLFAATWPGYIYSIVGTTATQQASTSQTWSGITESSGFIYACVNNFYLFKAPINTPVASQATAANRPIYQLDSKSLPYLAHDGTDSLSVALPDLGGGAFSSSGSVYFGVPQGMSALHNQSIGTAYTLPALNTNIYGWCVFHERLTRPEEAQLERYFLRLAGISGGPDYLLEDNDQQLTDDAGELLLRG